MSQSRARFVSHRYFWNLLQSGARTRQSRVPPVVKLIDEIQSPVPDLNVERKGYPQVVAIICPRCAKDETPGTKPLCAPFLQLQTYLHFVKYRFL